MLTTWIGGTWAIGFLAAPVLFKVLPDHAQAGDVAARLFFLSGWIGLGCAGFLLLCRLQAAGAGALRQLPFWLLLALLGLTALGLFGVAPVLAGLRAQALPHEVMQTVLRDRFVAWHGISSLLYLIQSLLGAWLVALAGRGAR